MSRVLRHSFSIRFANELWQTDTMYGPAIQQPDGAWRKTFLIAFIDDASRVIAHGEFFYQDNTANMVHAFSSPCSKEASRSDSTSTTERTTRPPRSSRPACDWTSNCPAPIRDGAAKGRSNAFAHFRGLRSLSDPTPRLRHSGRFEPQGGDPTGSKRYNARHHSGIGMIPLDRSISTVTGFRTSPMTLTPRKSSLWRRIARSTKTNLFSIHSQKFERPVDLRQKVIQVRFDRQRRTRYPLRFKGNAWGRLPWIFSNAPDRSRRPRMIKSTFGIAEPF